MRQGRVALDDRHELFLDGAWVQPSSRRQFTSIDTYTEEPIASFPEGRRADIDAAVTAARRAFDDPRGWAHWPGVSRAQEMEAWANAIELRTSELGSLIAREVGTPIERAVSSNVDAATSLLRFYARLAAMEDQLGLDVRPARLGRSLVCREPLGVIGAIPPWNYPLSTLFFKLGPALAMGCTVVAKPSPTTGLDSFLVADALAETEIPPGVVNFVPGGREVGEYLVAHQGIDKVAFTGSTAAGRRIGSICGDLVRPVTLELGGKSAAVLLSDARLDDFLENLAELCFANNGQTCTNNSRVLVPRARLREVSDAIVDTVSAWAVGDPLDSGTRIGPLAGDVQRRRIEAQIETGRAEGARIMVGGVGQRTEQGCGYFVRPTIFTEVSPGMSVARHEIFGPVVSILEYDGGDAGAIGMANDSEYGLSASVWSADTERAMRVASQIDAGTVSVNHANFDIGAPFGGRKQSGIGSELGKEAIEAYIKLKTVFLL